SSQGRNASARSTAIAIGSRVSVVAISGTAVRPTPSARLLKAAAVQSLPKARPSGARREPSCTADGPPSRTGGTGGASLIAGGCPRRRGPARRADARWNGSALRPSSSPRRDARGARSRRPRCRGPCAAEVARWSWGRRSARATRPCRRSCQVPFRRKREDVCSDGDRTDVVCVLVSIGVDGLVDDRLDALRELAQLLGRQTCCRGGEHGDFAPFVVGAAQTLAEVSQQLLVPAVHVLGDHDLGRRTPGGRLQRFRVAEADRTDRTLPPALPRAASSLHLADEVMLRKCAKVVARGAGRLPRPLGERAGGLRAVLAEDVVDLHPERVGQCAQGPRVEDADVLFVGCSRLLLRHDCKDTFASCPLQGFLCKCFFAARSTPITLVAMTDAENPLLAPSDLPYGLPRYDLIRPEHYLPAFERAFAEHLQEIAAITRVRSMPTFENTMVPLEAAGGLLDRVARTFYTGSSADATPAIQEIEETLAPLMSAHEDAIRLDAQLYWRIRTLHEQLDGLDLSPEQRYLVER